MLITTLVMFPKPTNLTLFLEVCVEFAGMDIFSAQSFFENNFKWVKTEPLNDAFDFYGIGDMIMLVQSGPYFPLQLIIILRVLILISLNRIAKCCP